jgi:hypothetical protein
MADNNLAMASNCMTMTLKKKWFDMILSGEKKEEYREIKDYWLKRFGHWVDSDYESGYRCEEFSKFPDYIKFVNGYGNHCPYVIVKTDGWRFGKSTHPEWGGDTEDEQLIIELGEIIETKL